MTWQVAIDWDRDNNYTGTYDDITEYVREIDWELGCRTWSLIGDAAIANITVDNRDKRFSPEYAAGPLYGQLVPGLSVQIKFGDTVMWTGLTGLFKPEPFIYGERTAALECVGIKASLEKFQLYVDLYESVTADTVIADIMTQVAKPPAVPGLWILGISGFSELGVSTFLGSITDVATLDTGLTTFAYVGDNFQADGRPANAYDVIRDLIEGERGRFFINRDGKGEFWNRHHLLNDFTVDYTVDNTAESLEYATPYSEMTNLVEVTCYPREETAGNSELIWELKSSIELQPLQTKIIYVEYKDDKGLPISAKDLQTPSGADLTIGAGGSVSVEGAGQRAKITIANSSTNSITLSVLKLRGRVVSDIYPLTVRVQDDTSISSYGQQMMMLSIKALDDESQATDIANFELARRKSVMGRIESVRLMEKIGRIEQLKNYWKMEESSGTRFDAHGSVALSDTNDTSSGTGMQGNAARFWGATTATISGTISTTQSFVHSADCRIRVDIASLQSSGNMFVVFRRQDASNFWNIAIGSDGSLTLNEVNASVTTARDTAAAGTAGANDEIMCVAYGNEIRVFCNGTLELTYSSSFLASETDGRAVPNPANGGTLADLDVYDYPPDSYLSVAGTGLELGDIDFVHGMWVNFDGVLGAAAAFAGQWNTGGNKRIWQLRKNTSNVILFDISTDGTAGGVVTTSSGVTISAGVWYFVLAWHDAANNELGIRVNATEVTASHSGGVYGAGTAALFIGSTNSLSSYWSGRIDEVMRAKFAPSANQRDWLYNSGAGRSYDDLLTSFYSDQINYGVGDLVRVVDDQTSHDENYHIVGERHSLDVANGILNTTWLLEPNTISPFWALGQAGFSELGVTTILAY